MHIFALSRHSFEQLVTKNNGNPYTKQSTQLKKFFYLIITGTYGVYKGRLLVQDKILFLHKRKQHQDVTGRHID
jgi:hypothetical protein